MHALAVLASASVAAASLAACADDPAADDAPGAADAGADGPPTFAEDFGAGPGWPAGWTALGGVASATVVGGRGALVPTVSDYSLARMGHALPAGTRDVDVTLVLAMPDGAHQGVGLYVRQNGGYLRQSATPGGGYAVFVEAFRGPSIGLWAERDGVEVELARVPVAALADGTAYRVHFRVAQDGAVTALAATLWPDGTDEPAAWQVTTTDATPALQDLAGGVAVDAWNTATPSGGPPPQPIFVDELAVRTR